jgi:flagellar motor component MotA
MFVIIGIVMVFAWVLGGYVAMGGKLFFLWQPFEVVIIVGGALVGTFLGVFVEYGFCGPLATTLTAKYDADSQYFSCMKAVFSPISLVMLEQSVSSSLASHL